MTEEEKLEQIKNEENADTQTASPENLEQQDNVDEENQGEPAVDDDSQPNPESAIEENQVQQEQPRMFTQEELNDIVGKTRIEARDKANAAYLERYGVADDNELNEVVGRGQSYSYLEEQYKNADSELKQLRIENALLKSGIVKERYEDAKLIITGKGLDVNEQTIAQELTTHPEWMGNNQFQPTPTTQVQSVVTPVAEAQPQKIFTREMAENAANIPSQPMQQPQQNVVKKFGNPVSESGADSEDEEAKALRFMGL